MQTRFSDLLSRHYPLILLNNEENHENPTEDSQRSTGDLNSTYLSNRSQIVTRSLCLAYKCKWIQNRDLILGHWELVCCLLLDAIRSTVRTNNIRSRRSAACYWMPFVVLCLLTTEGSVAIVWDRRELVASLAACQHQLTSQQCLRLKGRRRLWLALQRLSVMRSAPVTLPCPWHAWSI
jgi:hypothetical protein